MIIEKKYLFQYLFNSFHGIFTDFIDFYVNKHLMLFKTKQSKMLSGTINSKTSLQLPKYFWKWEGNIQVFPRDKEWITINWIHVSPSTIKWVKDITWARYVELITNWRRIKVIEHIISALIASWITQADLKIKDRFVPVIWPWITPVFENLRTQVDTWSELPIIRIGDFGAIRSDNYLWAQIIFEPSNTFDVSIETHHPDLADIWASRLDLVDVYSQIERFSDARPIARLQKKIVYCALNIFSKIPPYLNGINPDTYILAKPWEKWDQIIERMWAKYQEDRNEHLYHTVFADFLWEVSIFFPWKIEWKFTLINTNHVSRVEILKKIFKSNSLINE